MPDHHINAPLGDILAAHAGEYYARTELAKKTKTIAVDLDGTLSKSRKDGQIGDPVKKMVDRVNRWHKNGVKVIIFTARLEVPGALRAIRFWMKENGLPDLEITNIKTGDIQEFWDNRAIRVEDSTGVICGQCDKSRGKDSPSLDFKTDC